MRLVLTKHLVRGLPSTIAGLCLMGLVFAVLAGCVSIMKGTKQEVTFKSVPDGALVTVDGRTLGRTPLTSQLSRQKGRSAVFEKDGYKSTTVGLHTDVDPWFWGNILIGGVLGSTTDNLNGAVYRYGPDQYLVTLEPADKGKLELQAAISNSDKIRQFVLLNNSGVQSDLAKGYGESLQALLGLLSVKQADYQPAIVRIRALATLYSDPGKFANGILENFGMAEAPASGMAVAPALSAEPRGTQLRVAVFPFHIGGPTTLTAQSWMIDAIEDGLAEIPKATISYSPYPRYLKAPKLPDEVRLSEEQWGEGYPNIPEVLLRAKGLNADAALLISYAYLPGYTPSPAIVTLVNLKSGEAHKETTDLYSQTATNVKRSRLAAAITKLVGDAADSR